MDRLPSLTCLILCLFSVPRLILADTSTETLASLVKAHEAGPQDVATSQNIEKAVSAGLPDDLDPALLPDLPVTTAPLPDGLGTLVVPKPYLPTPTIEPQHGGTFGRVTYLYYPSHAATEQLFCKVHYTTPDDAALAARIGGLLALAHKTLVSETGHEAAGGAGPFDVWLCRSGQSGGEQWHNNIYFYDLDTPRSSIEWIREIVHEYSHMSLPAIGGYSDPEYWANGYMGERLIVRWLARTPSGPASVERVWGDFSGYGNFERLLIAPALSLYKSIGPNPKWLARSDADGMRYLIGQALTMDDKYGARALEEAFQQLPRFREARATDLATAIADVVQERSGPRAARRSAP